MAELPRADTIAWLTLALLSLTATPAAQEDSPRGRSHYLGREIATTMHYRGAPWLVRESREREEDCTRLIRALGIRAGDVVCDFGCGNGFYTLALAPLVGAEGRILAVDIQKPMLTMLEGRARKAGVVERITPILGRVSDPRLPPASADLVLLVDVYHELSHPVSTLRGIRASLRPGGRMVLAEFREEDPKVPIKPLHKMSKRQILRELIPNGFRLAEEFDGLPWQHLMFFARDAEDPLARDARAALVRTLRFAREATGSSGVAGGETLLRAFCLTGERRALAAARAVGRSLAEDTDDLAVLTFLIQLDDLIAEPWSRQAVDRGLSKLLAAQAASGAWPEPEPDREVSLHEATEKRIRILQLAQRRYRRGDCGDAARRGIEFRSRAEAKSPTRPPTTVPPPVDEPDPAERGRAAGLRAGKALETLDPKGRWVRDGKLHPGDWLRGVNALCDCLTWPRR